MSTLAQARDLGCRFVYPDENGDLYATKSVVINDNNVWKRFKCDAALRNIKIETESSGSIITAEDQYPYDIRLERVRDDWIAYDGYLNFEPSIIDMEYMFSLARDGYKHIYSRHSSLFAAKDNRLGSLTESELMSMASSGDVVVLDVEIEFFYKDIDKDSNPIYHEAYIDLSGLDEIRLSGDHDQTLCETLNRSDRLSPIQIVSLASVLNEGALINFRVCDDLPYNKFGLEIPDVTLCNINVICSKSCDLIYDDGIILECTILNKDGKLIKVELSPHEIFVATDYRYGDKDGYMKGQYIDYPKQMFPYRFQIENKLHYAFKNFDHKYSSYISYMLRYLFEEKSGDKESEKNIIENPASVYEYIKNYAFNNGTIFIQYSLPNYPLKKLLGFVGSCKPINDESMEIGVIPSNKHNLKVIPSLKASSKINLKMDKRGTNSIVVFKNNSARSFYRDFADNDEYDKTFVEYLEEEVDHFLPF